VHQNVAFKRATCLKVKQKCSFWCVEQPFTWEVNQCHHWTSQQEVMHDSWSWNAPLQENVEVRTDHIDRREIRQLHRSTVLHLSEGCRLWSCEAVMIQFRFRETCKLIHSCIKMLRSKWIISMQNTSRLIKATLPFMHKDDWMKYKWKCQLFMHHYTVRKKTVEIQILSWPVHHKKNFLLSIFVLFSSTNI